MGSSIATALISSGIKCFLKEINQKFLDIAVAKVHGKFLSNVGNMIREFGSKSSIWKT